MNESPPAPPRNWERTRERSTPFMMRALVKSALLLGRAGLRPILYVTVAYFFVTSRTARHTSREFLQRVLDRPPTYKDMWRHLLYFATCSTDRFYFLRGQHRRFVVDVHRPADVLQVSRRGHGCLLVLAHFGSHEVLRLTGDKHDLPITILLDREIGRMLTGLLEELNPQIAQHVIDASKRGPELVLALKEAIEANRLIGIMGDRIREGDRSIRVDFLGAPAELPLGPWILAGALRVPVVLGFGIFKGGNRYALHFELLAERITLPRADREAALRDWAQRYADRLAHYVRLAPYNWFNFYDFWR